MERLEFLKNKKEMCEKSLKYCEERSKSVKEELSVINEMIMEIEGRMDNTSFEFDSEEKKHPNAAPKTGGGAPDLRHPVPCPKSSLAESVEKEITETMKLIIKSIQKQCDLPGNSAKNIYLLSLALKELNQLEPTKIKPLADQLAESVTSSS